MRTRGDKRDDPVAVVTRFSDHPIIRDVRLLSHEGHVDVGAAPRAWDAHLVRCDEPSGRLREEARSPAPDDAPQMELDGLVALTAERKPRLLPSIRRGSLHWAHWIRRFTG